MRHRALQLLILLVLNPAIANATPKLEDGYTAFEQGDTARAVEIWRELAEQGNATAQLNLGQLYRQGKGVPQNDKEAVSWYIKASQNSSDIARYTLGLMHQEGRATDGDLAEAGLVVQAPQVTASDPKKPSQTWLQQLPPDAYLIQIVATSQQDSLQRFSDEHLASVKPTPQIVRTKREEKNWYQLVIGPFSSRQAAQQAASKLPKTTLANEPWLRTAKSLQQIEGK